MGLTWLEPGAASEGPRPGLAGDEHESRRLLHRLRSGDQAARRELRELYEGQADIWAAWCLGQPEYLLPLEDALRRGGLTGHRAVEVSAGSGQATALLARHFGLVVATDPSPRMLKDLPASARVHRVLAESARLPIADRSVDAVVGLNAVPDLPEFRRVLAPGGAVLWVSSFGDETPLYVPPRQLAGEWPGEAIGANAGHGDWLLLRSPDES